MIWLEYFSKKVDLEQHLMSRMIDEKQAQRVRCIECFKGFKSKKYLEDHIKREHITGSRETCDDCWAEFKDRQVKHLHGIKHQKEKNDNYM